MRTTMTIEEALYRRLRRLATERRIPVKAVVNLALRAGLDALSGNAPGRKRFRQRTHRMGAAKLDLDKALGLVADLEAEEVVRKQRLRK